MQKGLVFPQTTACLTHLQSALYQGTASAVPPARGRKTRASAPDGAYFGCVEEERGLQPLMGRTSGAGAKAQRCGCAVSARLKWCPDTRQVIDEMTLERLSLLCPRRARRSDLVHDGERP